VGALHNGVVIKSPQNFTLENISVFSPGLDGIISNDDDGLGSGAVVTIKNSIVQGGNFSIANTGAFTTRTLTNSVSSTASYGSWVLTNSPPNPPGGTTLGYGSCRTFMPAASVFAKSGTDGLPIGATVMYAYENGVLTSQKLWNSALTGADRGKWNFARAIKPGWNDSGNTIHNVHQRLGFGTGGCAFEGGY